MKIENTTCLETSHLGDQSQEDVMVCLLSAMSVLSLRIK